jgi:hypothetical protein
MSWAVLLSSQISTQSTFGLIEESLRPFESVPAIFSVLPAVPF